MSKNLLDQYFRQRLRTLAEPTPTHLWEGIAQRRAAARRGRRVKRLSAGLGLLLLLALPAYLLWNTGVQPAAADPAISSFPAAADLVAPLPSADIRVEVPEPNVPSLDPGSVTTRPAGTHAAGRTRALNGAITAPATNEPVAGEPVSAARTSARPAAVRPRTRPSVMPATRPLPATPTSPATQEEEAKRPSGPHIRNRDSSQTTTPSASPHPADGGAALRTAPRLGPHPANHQLPTKPTAATFLNNVAPVANCPTFKRNRPAWQFELLGGPAYAHQQLRARGPDDFGYLEARSGNEFPSISYQLSARLQFATASGLTLRSGLSFVNLRRRADYPLEGERMAIVTDRYDSGGTLIGSDTTFETTFRMVSSRNSLRQFELPLLVGYRFQAGKLRLNFQAGPTLGLQLTTDSRLLTPDGESVRPARRTDDADTAAGEIAAYRNSAALGFQASLTTTYPLGRRTSLLMEPFCKVYPRSFTAPSYPLREKYVVMGLQVGIGYRL